MGELIGARDFVSHMEVVHTATPPIDKAPHKHVIPTQARQARLPGPVELVHFSSGDWLVVVPRHLQAPVPASPHTVY